MIDIYQADKEKDRYRERLTYKQKKKFGVDVRRAQESEFPS